MCSIYGIIRHDGQEKAAEILRRMSALQRHRGPDGEGTYIDSTVALGHRRLSIIDLSDDGRQPMGNEDGSIQVVFNGEIYNFESLRSELLALGHQFKSRCDTECIVHLYEEYGMQGISRLEGMFAIAIYDRKKQEVFLVRDRMGQKPLLYFIRNKTLVFASEFAALKAHPLMPRELNHAGISDYVSLQYIPAPDTIYQDCHKLMPGSFLYFSVRDGSWSKGEYYRLNYSDKLDISFEDASMELRKLVEAAVQKRLVSDVPIGVFLSGGVDSTIICSLMTRFRYPQETDCFTIGFENRSYDERIFARIAGANIRSAFDNKLQMHEKIVNPCDFELLQTMVRHYGEPYADSSMLPTFLLSQFTREHVTVALSGDGADELFAGYNRYLLMKYASNFDFLPSLLRKMLCFPAAGCLPNFGDRSMQGKLKRALRAIGAPRSRRYFSILDRCVPQLKHSIFGEKMRDALKHDSNRLFAELNRSAGSENPVEKCLECDMKTYLPNDILTKIDIASMANSLELRSPFMDHHVVDFAARLPFEFKQSGSEKKCILRHAFRDILPHSISKRAKKGFAIPVASWLRGPWHEIAEERIFHSILTNEGYFDAEALQMVWKKHQSGNYDYSYLLWSLLLLDIFLEQEAGK